VLLVEGGMRRKHVNTYKRINESEDTRRTMKEKRKKSFRPLYESKPN
jgi:hypothetical protein